MTVHSLCRLVSGLRAKDIREMSESDQLDFKASAMSDFAAATSGIVSLLFPAGTNLERLVWHVVAAEPWCLHWIGRFSLQATDRMEANLGQTKRVALAAAMWPAVKLTVDLMGDYHYPGGLNVEPALHLSVRVDGGAREALRALEDLSTAVCDRLKALSHCPGVELRVRTVEDAMDDQVNPPNLRNALAAARRAAIKAAGAQGDEDTESLEIILELASGQGLLDRNLPEALASLGLLFAHCDAAARTA